MGFFTRTKKITKPQTDVNNGNPPLPQSQYCPTAPGHEPQLQQQQPSGYPQGPLPFGVQPGYGRQQQQHQLQYQPQPIVVNQYYISPQSVGQQTNMQLVHRPQQQLHQHQHQQPYFRPAPPAQSHTDKFSQSVANLTHAVIPTDTNIWHDLADIDAITEDWHPHATLLLNQTAACADILATGFDRLMTSIDREKYKGHEGDLFNLGGSTEKPSKSSSSTKSKRRDGSKKQSYKGDTAAAIASSPASTSIISKVELYANSRLPRDLPPLRLYMPTWPLLCLAAQYAERVYAPPSGAERDAHVPSNWRTGTKAMVIKSVPMDHMSCIVFAIRGTATFADWAVNLNAAPASPRGFLDDEDNLCHAGFLSVARSMIRPVASRLRQLLREDPTRANYSLVITGHSAGGAVASLLFCHMLAEVAGKAASELNAVAGCFKRVHCVVFGTPPVSRRPLQKPTRPELAKSLFLSFLNEGDPVARADKAYVKSLLELFASPAPKRRETERKRREKRDEPRFEREKGRKGSETVKLPAEGAVREKKSVVRFAEGVDKPDEEDEQARKERREKRRRGPVWKVPPSSLSSPGRIVVLRSSARGTAVRRTVEDRLKEGVVAQTVTDEQLRGVVWGDPVCHVMRLYAGRIEALAVGAVTGKG